MVILSIDPGPKESGFVIFNTLDGHIIESGVAKNNDMLKRVRSYERFELAHLAIEKVMSYGKPVGEEVFATCYFSGRLIEAWHSSEEVNLLPRKTVLSYLRASNDSTVRKALIELLELPEIGKGRYEISSHAWSALAVAVTASRFKKIV